VPVSNGVFTTTVDFGAGVFDGTAYWLAIGVRSNGVGSYTSVTPRQPVTPAPYALYATASAIADGAVTSAKILDGTIATADLANNAVTSAKIADGAIVNADLANDAVTSAKVLDGSILGADLAPNTVTSAQLADSIDLGTTNIAGALNVYRTSANTPSVSVFGSASQISTYGSDGLEQIRLWGSSYGELLLNDSSTTNHQTVRLTANGTSGGLLELNQGNSTAAGVRLYGDNLGGGRLLAYNINNSLSLDFRANFDSATSAGWGAFYDEGSERVTFAARNGTTTRGGLIDVKNDTSLNTIRLIGDTGSGDSRLEMYAGGTNLSFQIFADDSSSGSSVYLYNGAGQTRVEIDSDDGDNGAVIRLYDAGGGLGLFLDADSSSAGYLAVYGTNGVADIILDGRDSGGNGRVICDVLQINGGSDLSEQFDVNTVQGAPEPGMVVCIDAAHPGQLRPSSQPYDRKVAGVISGGGGVQPGMLMGQRGTAADGKHPVALTGRVYVQATSANGAIEPGDLLTTSSIPGHAMKVTDHTRAQGAILGKAMTGLDQGKGTVLVLVSLQ
jgi:hypothetical protein